MTEHDLQTHLAEFFANIAMADVDGELDEAIAPALVEAQDGVAGVSTFAEAGVLTRDAGLVVRMRDGREFQITIVRSR